MNYLAETDPELFDILEREANREESTIELIASENFTSQAVMEMVGGVMTNKYAEGYPGRRYYGGCEVVDEAENMARDRLKKLFGAEYVNVQPHSGSQANMAVFMTFLKPGDLIMGLDLAHGGHLTHGSMVNFSGQLYKSIFYHVSKETGRVDFNEVRDLAQQHKPKLIICGGSAYPRFIEFEEFRNVADSIGAFLMADIAHPSGLVASGVHPSPIKYCDVVTSTTHKTLRGPRGGIIMMGKDFENPWGKKAPKSGRVKMVSELLDASVMPGVQGGPLMHVIAAKALCFKEALTPEFKEYQQQVIMNAKALAEGMERNGFRLVSGGTDNHLLLVDVQAKGLTGKECQEALDHAGITVNKNTIPFETLSPFKASGVRLGTPAVTTRGMREPEMAAIADMIAEVLTDVNNVDAAKKVRQRVRELTTRFPLPY